MSTSAPPKPKPPYEPPKVTVLGTLAELTAGGNVPLAPSDMYGNAGAMGYLGG